MTTKISTDIYEFRVTEREEGKWFTLSTPFASTEMPAIELSKDFLDCFGMVELYRASKPFSYGHIWRNGELSGTLTEIFGKAQDPRAVVTILSASALQAGDELRILMDSARERKPGFPPTATQEMERDRPFVGRGANIEIDVVEKDGRKLFRYKDPKEGQILFTSLDAYDFCGGSLKVERNGEEIAATRNIDWYGTHGACPCFVGLDGLFAQEAVTPGLGVTEFEIGDRLMLEAPWFDKKASFGRHLKQSNALSLAILASFEEKKSQTMDEFAENIAKKLEERSQKPPPDILTFGRGGPG